MSKRFFLIFCATRTGSTLLTDLLNSHPDICCMHEATAGELRNGMYWRETLFKRAEREGPTATLIGTDVKYYQVWPDMIGAVPAIHLVRKSVARRCVSEVIRKLGKPKLSPETPMTVPVNNFMKEAREYIVNATLFSRVTQHTIFYEDITNDGQDVRAIADDGARTAILEFLGVEDRPLTTGIRKRNPNELERSVTNLAELKRKPIFHCVLNGSFLDTPTSEGVNPCLKR